MKTSLITLFILFGSMNVEAKSQFLKKFNSVFSKNKQVFSICHEQARERNYNIKGKIDYHFSLLPNGKIDMIGVIEHLNIQDRTLVRCIYNKARKFQFPRTGMKKIVKVSKVFTI